MLLQLRREVESLDELPLHTVRGADGPTFVGPGKWWACEHPERKAEVNRTNFDLRCQACRIAAVAHMRDPGSHLYARADAASGYGTVRMDDAIESAIKEAGADGQGEVTSL